MAVPNRVGPALIVSVLPAGPLARIVPSLMKMPAVLRMVVSGVVWPGTAVLKRVALSRVGLARLSLLSWIRALKLTMAVVAAVPPAAMVMPCRVESRPVATLPKGTMTVSSVEGWAKPLPGPLTRLQFWGAPALPWTGSFHCQTDGGRTVSRVSPLPWVTRMLPAVPPVGPRAKVAEPLLPIAPLVPPAVNRVAPPAPIAAMLPLPS